MEQYKNEYIDFLLKVKGVSVDYTRATAFNLAKVFEFLKKKGIKNARDVDRQHLDEFQKKIMRSRFAVATKQYILCATVLFFRYLSDYGHIAENPGLIIEPPKREHHVPRNIMNKEEIKYLLTLPNHRDLLGMRDICIMKLLYSSAARPKEIFNLKIGDIDLSRNQALIKRPKNRQDRIVYFDNYTSKHITNYIEKARFWLLKGRVSDSLLISATGSDLIQSSWAAHFSNRYAPTMRKKFNKHLTPYAFRHTSATHWLDNGAKQKRDILPYIQRHLGHESLESTAIYTHVAIEPLRQMFKQYHPRELYLKNLHKIPPPNDIILQL